MSLNLSFGNFNAKNGLRKSKKNELKTLGWHIETLRTDILRGAHPVALVEYIDRNCLWPILDMIQHQRQDRYGGAQ